MSWTPEDVAAHYARLKQPQEGATPAPSHGIDCPKAVHDPKRTGYLHSAEDDTPYDVDGLPYCGRCHYALPKVARAPDRLEAPIQAEMCQFLREDGWEILITNPVSDRSKGRGFGTPGMADFLAMRPMKKMQLGSGYFVEVNPAVCEVLWVEAKAGKNRAGKHQAEWHRNQRAIGFLTWIANEDFPATVEGFKAHYRASGLARRRVL